jgi:pyrimidine-nucleoside phosphorylase
VRAVDIIVEKREGKNLSREEMEFMVQGYVKETIPDYQLAAFLMAVFFQGLSFTETGFLTQAMLASGKSFVFKDFRGTLIDKHSTGGVGDKVSLVLAPLAAACGLKVPMMSGRGLGHTGGTLDKLEAIKGYKTELSYIQIEKILSKVGFVWIGQTDELVPADKKMYALRDVTGTVESVPLITASILSKKCAEGAEGFVFDVKTGSGAFMKTSEQAEVLALSLVNTARNMGKKALAVITDMSHPLGKTVGNALEVQEALECLQGKGPADVLEVTLRLTAHMLVLGKICSNMAEAEELAGKRLASGEALTKFLQNVELQGGDPDKVLHPGKQNPFTKKIPFPAWEDGYIATCDAYKVGLAAVHLGAGRARKEEAVLPHVGIELIKVVGDKASRGDVLAYLYTDRGKGKEEAWQLLKNAYKISPQQVTTSSRILKEIVDV